MMHKTSFSTAAEPTGIQGYERVPEEFVIFDENGIWWTSDCYDEVPWPTTLDTTVSESSSESSESSAASEQCPTIQLMRLLLSFTKMTFATSNTMVTSLVAAENSGLIIRCRTSGDPASTGNLEIDFDLDILVSDETDTGHIVFKKLENGQFTRGPVLEGLISGGGEVTITSTAPTAGNPVVHQGIATVSFSSTATLRELETQLVRLADTTEEFYESIPFLGMKAGKDASYTAKINVPTVGLPADPKLKLRFRFLGRAAGTLPSLSFSIRKVPKNASLGAAGALSLPTTDSAITVSMAEVVAADEYIEAESSLFDIDPGDIVYFTVTRSSADGYPGLIGILQQVGVPVAGP